MSPRDPDGSDPLDAPTPPPIPNVPEGEDEQDSTVVDPAMMAALAQSKTPPEMEAPTPPGGPVDGSPSAGGPLTLAAHVPERPAVTFDDVSLDEHDPSAPHDSRPPPPTAAPKKKGRGGCGMMLAILLVLLLVGGVVFAGLGTVIVGGGLAWFMLRSDGTTVAQVDPDELDPQAFDPDLAPPDGAELLKQIEAAQAAMDLAEDNAPDMDTDDDAGVADSAGSAGSAEDDAVEDAPAATTPAKPSSTAGGRVETTAPSGNRTAQPAAGSGSSTSSESTPSSSTSNRTAPVRVDNGRVEVDPKAAARAVSGALSRDDGTVKVDGDAKVVLVKGKTRVPVPGPVSAGKYDIEATFPGEKPVVVGTVKIDAGATTTLACKASMGICRAR